jgi:DNA processing protein
MTKRESDWGDWVALKMVRGVGNILGLRLLQSFGSPRAILDAGSQALECAGVRRDVARAIGRFDAWGEVERQLARLRQLGGRLVTWEDEAYPELLRQIADAPLFFFMRGDLDPVDAQAVAVVGSRSPTSYGRRMARLIGAGLAEQGATVVSGLARGIDAEAHWAALKAGGRTVAVLGCGVDVAYPAENRHLMMRIARCGAVISELPMGTQPDAENFPGRNRIISGMSLGTVVVEAAERSGSLITAQFAADQGRDVFAVPGPVGEQSRGPHKLLRQGAALAESANDVMNEIAPHRIMRPVPVVVELSATDAAVVRCLANSVRHVDEIIRLSSLPTPVVLEALLSLELRGVVRQLPGKCFSLEEKAGEGQLRLC